MEPNFGCSGWGSGGGGATSGGDEVAEGGEGGDEDDDAIEVPASVDVTGDDWGDGADEGAASEEDGDGGALGTNVGGVHGGGDDDGHDREEEDGEEDDVDGEYPAVVGPEEAEDEEGDG